MRYVEGADLRTLVRAEQRAGARRAPRTSSPRSAQRARRRARARHRPPRRQARQRPARRRRPRLPHRLRADQAPDLAHAARRATGGWVGTLGYVAPEQIRGERVDARADVYALGCVLYHALTGVAALPARERRGDAVGAPQRRPALAARPRARTCPPSFDAVLARALAKDPDDRFPSAGDLGRAALAAAGRPVAPRARARGRASARPRPATARRPSSRPTRRRRVLAAERTRPRAPAVAVGAGRGADRRAGADRGPRPRRRWAAAATATARRRRATDRHQHDRRRPQTTAIKDVVVGGRPNDIVVADGKAWVVRSGNAAARGRSTPRRSSAQPYSPRVGATRAARPPASASSGSINQDAPSLVPIGLKSHRQEGQRRPAARPGQGGRGRRGEQRVWVGVRGNPGLLLRDRPQEPRASRPRPSSCPTACRTSPSAAARCGSSRGAANTVTRLDIASGTQRPIFVGEKPFGIAYGRGAVWVTNNGDDTVTRIDSGSLNTQTIAGRARAQGRSPSARAPSGSPTRSPRRSRASTRRPASPSATPIDGRAQPLRRRHAAATTSGSRAPATARSSG